MRSALVIAALAASLLSVTACKKATFCSEYPDLCPTNEGGRGEGGGAGGGGEGPGGAPP